MLPEKRNDSTPSWLLPAPLRRLRDHLREIRREASQAHWETVDTHRELTEGIATLSTQMRQLHEEAEGQREEISRLATRLDEFSTPSGSGMTSRSLMTRGGARLTRSMDVVLARVRPTSEAPTERLLRGLDALGSRPWRLPLVRAGVRAANAVSASKTFVPIAWLDTLAFAEQLGARQVARAVGPDIDGHPVTEQVVLPPVGVYELQNVTINPRYSAFASEKRLIIERIVGIDDPDRCFYLFGHHLIYEGRRAAAIAEHQVTHLPAGFFLGGPGYWNYYHWMIEILPKLRYWQRLLPELRELPLLIGERVFQSPSMLDALSRFCDSPNVTCLNDYEMYTVAYLLHINAPNAFMANMRDGEQERVTDTLVRPETIHDWRQRVRLGEDPPTGPRRRLFLARGAGLRSYNQVDVLQLFTAEGFEVVRLEEMTLQEQIDAMSSAEMVAGPVGAAWTNLIFCTRGTKALSWMPEEERTISIYSTIASIIGVDLRYLTYRTGAHTSSELYDAPYELDLAEVRRALTALITDQSRG